MKLWVSCLGLVVAAAVASSSVRAADTSEEGRRVLEATAVFTENMSTPNQEIPATVLDKAEAIAIFPSLAKGGFLIGGQWGRGIITVRDPKTRRWSAPAFLTLGGGSVGAQIGATAIDLILIVRNRRGVEHLLSNEFKIGGEASVAVGPVGRATEASTDATMRAEILSYSRSRGLFVGAAFAGSVVKQDKDANLRYYGKAMTSEEIVFDDNGALTGTGPLPESAKSLQDTLARYTRSIN